MRKKKAFFPEFGHVRQDTPMSEGKKNRIQIIDIIRVLAFQSTSAGKKSKYEHVNNFLKHINEAYEEYCNDSYRYSQEFRVLEFANDLAKIYERVRNKELTPSQQHHVITKLFNQYWQTLPIRDSDIKKLVIEYKVLKGALTRGPIELAIFKTATVFGIDRSTLFKIKKKFSSENKNNPEEWFEGYLLDRMFEFIVQHCVPVTGDQLNQLSTLLKSQRLEGDNIEPIRTLSRAIHSLLDLALRFDIALYKEKNPEGKRALENTIERIGNALKTIQIEAQVTLTSKEHAHK